MSNFVDGILHTFTSIAILGKTKRWTSQCEPGNMKHSPAFHFKTSMIFGMMTLLYSCQPKGKFQEEANVLLKRAISIEHKHTVLNNSIDSLWDETTFILEEALPPDFPPVDRQIFLTSRNADHIRMFMTFKTLSHAIQAVVDAAGKEDERLASKIRALLAQKEEYENQKNLFLQKVAKHDPNVGRRYAEQFRMSPTLLQ